MTTSERPPAGPRGLVGALAEDAAAEHLIGLGWSILARNLRVAADEIEPPPSLGMRLNAEFVKGMGKRDDRFIIILDVNRIFSTEELIEFQGTEEEAQSAEAVEGEDAAQ